jgi:hypothetical protein
MGIGDWGLGIGDWAQSPIPNPHPHIFVYTVLINIIFLFYPKLFLQNDFNLMKWKLFREEFFLLRTSL